MEYNREYWQPRIATNPNRFRKLNESNDYVELINEPEAITQAGTAFTADRLNNIEAGIEGAVAGVNEIQGVLDFTEAVFPFSGLSQTTRLWNGMTTLGNDVYACVYAGDIYKQAGGEGDFIALGQTSRRWAGMTTLGNDVYACVYTGDIYKQAGGEGDFIALGQKSRLWNGMTTLGNDVYACVYTGDIYKQAGGEGDFIALGQESRQWYGMTTLGNDVYACVYAGDIYKQAGGEGDFIALGQATRRWAGMTTLGNDVYASVNNGDIYKQTGGAGDFIALGQTPRVWHEMTTLGNDVYACVYAGDIYTATVLTGNTFRTPSSFTLPAMPDGARKRILNTHATNAITVTAYSGTTIEGQATMTLSAGHEVELELIGSDWRKTGWNEKSLASFVGPVDCSSRVAEYTGDGIPMIPDNAAGRTYFQDEWATTDGWSGINCTIGVSGGKLFNSSPTNVNQYITKTFSSTTAGKTVRVKVRKLGGSATSIGISGNMFTSTQEYQFGTGNEVVADFTTTQTGTTIIIYPTYTGRSASDLWEIDTIYIGTGAYDTPALDRAGNGNNLTNHGVTPVNGKYGKEMSFNGSTSFAQASSPVIGTTGTIAIRFKRNTEGANHNLVANFADTTNGLNIRISSTNTVILYTYGTTGEVGYNLKTGLTDVSNYHTGVLRITGSQIIFMFDGADYTFTQTAGMVSGLANLTIGRRPIPLAGYDNFLNGIISHFRYDSRIWTADEARAWSLNPISIDSRV